MMRPIDEITELALDEPGFERFTVTSDVEATYYFEAIVYAQNFVTTVEAFKPDLRLTTGAIEISSRQVDRIVAVTITMPLLPDS